MVADTSTPPPSNNGERSSLGGPSTMAPPPPPPPHTTNANVSSYKPSHSLPNFSSAPITNTNNEQNASSSSLINQTVLSLATPIPRQVDQQAYHLLTIEMTHTMIQAAIHSARRQIKAREELVSAGLLPPSTNNGSNLNSQTNPALTNSSSSFAKAQPPIQQEELDNLIQNRLESIGLQVGNSLALHLSKDRSRFGETLDVLKFVCKELWTTIWGKQVDNLRTNHRGVYVLQDNSFKPLTSISRPWLEGGGSAENEARREVKILLSFPVGLVRGALAALDVSSTVVAETSQAPQCTFHVKTLKG
ncbi:hypothetical protein IE53DRAFT_388225 [Violaceomyces palustris]|uniref:Uncharacterized protein n=1 Tax=Violaceomyces palustris TaxID=1673888 RepID=A0ACD0NUR1_9BASI|nr:hypothetical protein IE53DRAFT_388225 [Violaceomyces palustris]